VTARDFAHVLFRHRRLAGLTLALTLLAGAVPGMLLPLLGQADVARVAEMESLAAAAHHRLDTARQRRLPGDADGRLLDRRARLEGDVGAAEAEAASLSGKMEVLRQRLAATPATIEISADAERSKVVEEARAKLFDLQTKEQELLGRYVETSPLVENVRAERRRVETLLQGIDVPVAARSRTGINEVHQELEKDAMRTEAALNSAKARGQALSRQLADLERRLQGSGQAEVSLLAYEREAAEADARLAANRPPASARLSPALWMGGALVAGLALALLAALTGERFSSRFATPADVERRLGLPVLCSLPSSSSSFTRSES
jgi:hypothetical protein